MERDEILRYRDRRQLNSAVVDREAYLGDTPEEASAGPERMGFFESFGERWSLQNPIANTLAVQERRRERGIDRAQGSISPERVVQVAEMYGLPPEAYDRLVETAQNEEDLETIAQALSEIDARRFAAQHGYGPIHNFLMEMGAGVLRPEYLVGGGFAGSAFRVGVASTRLGNIGRGAAAGLAVEAPIELLRTTDDYQYDIGHALITMTSSMALGAVIGGVGSLFRRRDVEEIKKIAENDFDRLQGGADAGAAQANPNIIRDAQEYAVHFADPGAGLEAGLMPGTPARALWGSENPEIRALADKVVWNPTSDQAQGATIYETHRSILQGHGTFQRQYNDARKAYFQSQEGQSARFRATGDVSDQMAGEFAEIVGLHRSGVILSENPHVRRAAEVMGRAYDDALNYRDSAYMGQNSRTGGEFARTGNVMEDWAEIALDPNYMIRRGPPGERFANWYKNFLGTTDPSKGHIKLGNELAPVWLRDAGNREWAERFAAQHNARRAENPQLQQLTPEAVAQRIMSAYARVWTDVNSPAARAAEIGSPLYRAVTYNDRSAAIELAKEAFQAGTREGQRFRMSGESIEEVAGFVADLIAPPKRQSGDARTFRRTRLPLNAGDRKILGMFDWNIERNAFDYRKNMAVRASLHRAGFKDEADFMRVVQDATKSATGKGAQAELRAVKEAELLRDFLGTITGRSDLMKGGDGGSLGFWSSVLRRLNTSAVMNNVAMSSASEIGQVMARAPMRVLRRIPQFQRLLDAARKNDVEKLDDLFVIFDNAGLGNHQSMNRHFGGSNRFTGDTVEQVPETTRARNWEERSRKAANATMRWSGQSGMQDYLRQFEAVTTAEDWIKSALNEGRLTHSPRVLRQMGLSDEMQQRVVDGLRKHAGFEKGQVSGRDRATLSQQWDDWEAYRAFVTSIDRRARQIVQDTDWGHVPTGVRNPFVSIMLQYLTYPMHAYTKQLSPTLQAIRHGEMEIVSRQLWAMGMAGAAHIVRVHVQAAGRDDPQAWIEERLTLTEMAKAAWYYSSIASLTPNAIDTAIGAWNLFAPADLKNDENGDPYLSSIWDMTRSSGMASNFVTGNATVSRLDRVVSAASSMADNGVNRQDMQRLITAGAPLGNHVLLQVPLQYGLRFLPDKDDE